MALTVGLGRGRSTFAASVAAFVATVEDASEWDLLGASRCHGWSRLDVVAHLVAGWQELAGGLLVRVTDAPTVDAASYWTAYAAEHADSDPVAVLMAQRRRGSAYGRPASARAQLSDVARALLDGVAVVPDQQCRFQGHVLTAGDLLASWAVENVVHLLDLDLGARVPEDACRLARETVEALAGPLPHGWSDEVAVLIGTGRLPVPAGTPAALAERLPAFG